MDPSDGVNCLGDTQKPLSYPFQVRFYGYLLSHLILFFIQTASSIFEKIRKGQKNMALFVSIIHQARNR
jgi:hypothetical protein